MKTKLNAEQFKLEMQDASHPETVLVSSTIKLEGDYARLWTALLRYHAGMEPSASQLVRSLVKTGLDSWAQGKGLV